MDDSVAQTDIDFLVRPLKRTPGSVDVSARTFGFIATTEQPVRRWISDRSRTDADGYPTRVEVDEVLPMDRIDMSRAVGMPLVDSHNIWSIDAIKGSVISLQVEEIPGVGRALTGTAQLIPSEQDRIAAMSEGHYAQLSIGYDPGSDISDFDIEPRNGDVPIARAKRWTLTEVSLVAVGADRFAQIRSLNGRPVFVRRSAAAATNRPEKIKMGPAEVLAQAEEAAAAAALAADLLDEAIAGAAEGTVSEEMMARAAAVRKTLEKPDDEPTDVTKPEDTADPKMSEDEIKSVRAIAARRGLDASLVDDLVALSTPAADVRSAVARAIAAKSAATISAPAPVPSNNETRSKGIDVTAVYAAYNAR